MPETDEILVLAKLRQQVSDGVRALNEATAALNRAVTRSWCFNKGDTVMVLRCQLTSLINPGPDCPPAGAHVVLKAYAPDNTSRWEVEGYPRCYISEDDMRPVKSAS